MKYLNLIRYKNLFLIALMQVIIVFLFLKIQNIEVALADWQFALLVVATVCIAAGGYIINDINDQETDAKNKKNGNIVGKTISEAAAYNLYVGFTFTGVASGFYLSRLIYRPNFVLVFILCAALLYIYATSLKQILIVKNIIVALMLSISILIVGLFEIFPATADDNRMKMTLVMSVLFDFATIAFIINFIREIVKDIEDVEGDSIQGIKTLPIAIGIEKTKKIVFGLSFVPLVCIIYYVYNYLFQLTYATGFIFLFLLGPLIYFTINLWTAQSKKEYSHLSTILKLIIFFGILAIGCIGINMVYLK
ncbi:MAG: geranylgeranylglycerol-phosphate geranylgeranyltransferase [Limnohabitans sp.]|nr:geranylgeranylglycerol-phosphate geranylgeranyltransferase [Limnohabitans sp.]